MTDAADLVAAPHCPRCHYGLLIVIAADPLAKLSRCFNCGLQESELHGPPLDPETGEPLPPDEAQVALGIGHASTAVEGVTSPSGAGTVGAAQIHGVKADKGGPKSKASGGSKGGEG